MVRTILFMFLILSADAHPKAYNTHKPCDHDNPCSVGLTCMTNPSTPTIRECYSGIIEARVRPGRCPLASESQPCPPSPTICEFDQDCPVDTDRCCLWNTCGRICLAAISIDPAPRVTILMNGTSVPIGPPSSPTGFQFYGATALVQSGGKNIQWETGGTGQIIQIVKALNDLAGLRMSDLHALLVSHGHPDHMANAGAFVDIPATIGTGPFTITGSEYMNNPLASADRFFFLDDRNLEVVKTPGHMLRDFSLIVRNVPGMGTVALVGDLFYDYKDKDDWQSDALGSGSVVLAARSRRAIVCDYGANYIFPGHGDMFQVTEETKKSTGIYCDAAITAAPKVALIILTLVLVIF